MASTAPTQTAITSSPLPAVSSTSAATNGTPAAAGSSSGGTPSTPVPHIRIVPHLDAPRSLHFEVVDKDVPDGFVLKIGRFTDKQNLPNRITFRSKVVSRGHAEIFTEMGKFYIRDTKSSSGTFLNHARLSPPGCESKPTPLKDGDVVQLGVDYQGGTQEIYRCVKMRLEINRGWQQQANPFRANTLKAIKSLTTQNAATATDCCICLFRIASFQSLFVAPCSHIFHYKCIRPMLVNNHPGFLCPLCRTFADLEDSVEIDDPTEEEQAVENAIEASKAEEPDTEVIPQSSHGDGTAAAAASSSSSSHHEQREQEQEQESPLTTLSEPQGSSSATSAPVPVNGGGRSGIIPPALGMSAAAGAAATETLPMSPGLNDICAPTPPSDLAHTFQPPSRPVSTTDGHERMNEEDEDRRQPRSSPRSRHATVSPAIILPTSGGHSRAVSTPNTSGSVFLDTLATPATGTTSSDAALHPIPSPARPRSSSSTTGSMRPMYQPPRTRSPSTSSPSVQQQQQQQQQHHHHHHHHSTSASSPSSNFLSNFVRSMTMPRSRSRTNSANQTHAHAHPPPAVIAAATTATTAAPGSNINQTTATAAAGAGSSGSNPTSDLHHDVYGKTLVVTPPPMMAGSARVQYPTGSGAPPLPPPASSSSSAAASSSLGPVTEVENRGLAAMQEEDVDDDEEDGAQASDEDGGVPSSVDDGTSSSDGGDVLMFGEEGASGGATNGPQQQRDDITAGTSVGGCEVVVVGNPGGEDLQLARETMTA
ncbi:hypothetical protein DFQ26_000777 [Actinomortierella ambigua]|nr:hypothetical protein DFQ26_000777 [Actinomortierella ambigua]